MVTDWPGSEVAARLTRRLKSHTDATAFRRLSSGMPCGSTRVQLSRRGGSPSRAWARHLLRHCPELDAEVRTGDQRYGGAVLARATNGTWTRWWSGSPASGCACGVLLTSKAVLDMLVQRR